MDVDLDVTLALTLLVAVVALIWWTLSRPSGKLPPGPKGLPFLGNIDFIRNSGRMQSYVKDLHREYGKIVTFKVGTMRFVWMNDGTLARQLFATDEFSDRNLQQLSFAKAVTGGDFGGIFLNRNGPDQFEMRKFALAALRDFGVGKKTLDESMQSECTAFSQMLEKAAESSSGVVSELKKQTQVCTANIIHDIIFGFRYEADDALWAEIRGHLNEFFSFNFLAMPSNFFPVLNYVPFLNSYLFGDQIERVAASNKYLEEYVQSQIEEHRSSYCEGEIRDFIDLYIKYEKESRPHYNSRNIFMTIMDLFRAGTDTTATTLAWAIQYLVKYPDLQNELQQEVDEMIGDRVFERKDKDKLIKVRAYLYELLRFASIAGQTVPRTLPVQTKIGDYTLPANSFFFLSIYSMHHDKKYWGDPENFRVDRWIGDDGELLLHETHFMPFSSGKRGCIGRQLVNIEVLLFLVEILQKFRFEKAEVGNRMTDETTGGVLRSPQSFHLKVIRRN